MNPISFLLDEHVPLAIQTQGSSRILIVPDALAGLPNPAVPRTGCWRFQLLLAWICNPGRAEWDSYFSGTAQLEQRAPEIRVHIIGDETVPVKGTPDPDILTWIEANGCLLVTNNRATIPVHLQAHLARGRHVPGIVQLPRRMNVGAILDDLLLLWGAGLPDEFQDQIIYLPL